MAERYHQGPHDSRSERSRRHKEMYGMGMIDEDHSAVANLPQGVKMGSYEQTGPWMPEIIDDTLKGVDKQMDRDDSQRRKYMKLHKF